MYLIVYTNDKLFITKSMSEKENEKFNDCLSINKYHDFNYIINICSGGRIGSSSNASPFTSTPSHNFPLQTPTLSELK